MGRFLNVLCAAVAVGLASFATLPCKAGAAEFSAELTRSSGGDEETSRVFLKGKLRREEVFDEGKLGAITILRPDKGVTWNLMPDEQLYMEIPLETAASGPYEQIDELEAQAKKTPLGKETLGGYECEKSSYAFDDKSRGLVTVWYSRKLEFPIKIQVANPEGSIEMVLEYKNIKPGGVPDSKFEIPAGYQKLSIPGMPGGMIPGGKLPEMPKLPGMPE